VGSTLDAGAARTQRSHQTRERHGLDQLRRAHLPTSAQRAQPTNSSPHVDFDSSARPLSPAPAAEPPWLRMRRHGTDHSDPAAGPDGALSRTSGYE